MVILRTREDNDGITGWLDYKIADDNFQRKILLPSMCAAFLLLSYVPLVIAVHQPPKLILKLIDIALINSTSIFNLK